MSADQTDLIKRAQHGDRDAMGLLWDELTPKLFGYLINTLRDRSRAQDILQSTWIKVAQALPEFRPRGAGFQAWVFAIARNECLDYWRKAKRETQLDPERHDAPAEGGNLEEKLLVEHILTALPEDDRELLRLRYIADLQLEDIAKVLNVNYVTVRVRVHRALARAREILSQTNETQ